MHGMWTTQVNYFKMFLRCYLNSNIYNNFHKPGICIEFYGIVMNFAALLHCIHLNWTSGQAAWAFSTTFLNSVFWRPVCHDSNVNYSTIGTQVRLLVRSSVVCVDPSNPFTVMYSTITILFLFCLFLICFFSFSTYLNYHWNKCAFWSNAQMTGPQI